ncbi:MAG: hypothetical protein ACRBDL_02935 [Alphaproteobacteria bacterium]
MDIEIPTEKLALKIWWAMTWRLIPLIFVGAFIVGLILGLIGTSMGIESRSIETIAGFSGAFLGLFLSVKVIMHLMTKGFGEYRLAVVRK